MNFLADLLTRQVSGHDLSVWPELSVGNRRLRSRAVKRAK
jgi:hypothetical protein